MQLNDGRKEIQVHTGRSKRFVSVNFVYNSLMDLVARSNGTKGDIDLIREAWGRCNVEIGEALEIMEMLVNNGVIEQRSYSQQPIRRYYTLNYSPAIESKLKFFPL
ncbi:MAG: hypothetical protein AABX03_04295 [Nanoarchaeota archaeon]